MVPIHLSDLVVQQCNNYLEFSDYFVYPDGTLSTCSGKTHDEHINKEVQSPLIKQKNTIKVFKVSSK